MSSQATNAPSLGPLLARGRTADVYAWEPGYALKLFHAGFDLVSIEAEGRIARAVLAGGLPVPAVRELIWIDGRAGLIYERVAGPSMLDLLSRKPWRLFAYARRLARLQARLHAVHAPVEVPAQRPKLARKIGRPPALPADVRAAALAALASLPEGEQLCHGDFHPANILMPAAGEVVIDWMDATCGNPLADVARTTIIMLGEAHSDQPANPVLKRLVGPFHQAYLRAYARLRPLDRGEYHSWLPVVAAARLSEDIPGQERWLISQAQPTKRASKATMFHDGRQV